MRRKPLKRAACLVIIFLFLALLPWIFGPTTLSAKEDSSAKTTAAADCLEYGPAVQFTGKLVKKTFPGPPNFTSVAQGDTPEVGWILHLDIPICVKARAGDDFDVAVSHLTDLQLVLGNDDYYRQVKKFLTTKVIVTGVLFGAHTGHHHTPVLLDVKNIQVMVDKY
jgi:hypothetical protein